MIEPISSFLWAGEFVLGAGVIALIVYLFWAGVTLFEKTGSYQPLPRLAVPGVVFLVALVVSTAVIVCCLIGQIVLAAW